MVWQAGSASPHAHGPRKPLGAGVQEGRQGRGLGQPRAGTRGRFGEMRVVALVREQAQGPPLTPGASRRVLAGPTTSIFPSWEKREFTEKTQMLFEELPGARCKHSAARSRVERGGGGRKHPCPTNPLGSQVSKTQMTCLRWGTDSSPKPVRVPTGVRCKCRVTECASS